MLHCASGCEYDVCDACASGNVARRVLRACRGPSRGPTAHFLWPPGVALSWAQGGGCDAAACGPAEGADTAALNTPGGGAGRRRAVRGLGLLSSARTRADEHGHCGRGSSCRMRTSGITVIARSCANLSPPCPTSSKGRGSRSLGRPDHPHSLHTWTHGASVRVVSSLGQATRRRRRSLAKSPLHGCSVRCGWRTTPSSSGQLRLAPEDSLW